jgi:hypothetical protein
MPENDPDLLTPEFVGKPLPGEPQAPQGGLQRPPGDDIQTRIQIGMAFNAAYTLLASPTASEIYNDVTPSVSNSAIDTIRQLRDRIYHGIIQVPIEPLHYCYEHESERRQGSLTGTWVHLVDGNREQPCFENPQAVMDLLEGDKYDSINLEGEL